jgi:hypothetical protein
MIKGLDKFKAHFAQHAKSFVLIGGVACHEWPATQGLEFRATRDIDIVLIVEALDQGFIARFWEFVDAGQYEIRERATGKRELYRFSKPKDDTYPTMLELFSRQPGKIDLSQIMHYKAYAVKCIVKTPGQRGRLPENRPGTLCTIRDQPPWQILCRIS